jgi:hypothetical protein
MHTKIWLEKLKGRDHPEDLGVHGKVILDCMEMIGKVWTGFICLRIGTSKGEF